MKEKVSVLMSAYNAQNTITEAIQSIILQSYANWELIICDDGSKDNTYGILMTFANKYPEKIKVIRHKENQYLSKSLNDCLELATGKYIARMDADDKSAPNRFEKQVEYLEKHHDVQMVGSACMIFNEHGEEYYKNTIEKPDKYCLAKGSFFVHGSIMIYTDVIRALNGYLVSNRTKRSQDYELWFRFFAAGYHAANINEPLYYYREDADAQKRRSLRSKIYDMQTALLGYKMLKYPLFFYPIPVINLLKGLVPNSVVVLYRRQKSRMLYRK